MLLDLTRRFIRLFRQLSAEGNAPEGPGEDATTDILPETGEQREPLTSFGYLRDLVPTLRALTPRQPGVAMTPNEVAAWDMLCQHGFSRASLRQTGELEAYLSLGVRPQLENSWRTDYALDLLARYETRPEGMDAALLIAAEYGDEALLSRALDALDDEIGTGHVPGEVLLENIRNAMYIASSDLFSADFGAETRGLLTELANRAEFHLSRYDPDGPWREVLAAIRRDAAAAPRSTAYQSKEQMP